MNRGLSNNKSMEVLFMFGGLPHYYNKILNRLNEIENLNISVLVPSNTSKVLGEGVHQSKTDLNFRLIYLPEYKTFYGKTFFKDFQELIIKNNYSAIVTIWPYILGFFCYPSLLKLIRRKGIKILYKDIPFQLPKFTDGLRLKVNEQYEEDSIKTKLSFFQKVSLMVTTLLRKTLYTSVIDAHLNYTEDAYEILKSYGVKKEKVFVTYNSPDTEALFEAGKEAREIGPIITYNNQRLIHIGRLVKWKRVDLIINAVASLKKKFDKIELIVIGTGPELNNLKKLTEELQVSDRINFVGGVYDPVQLGRYMEASSVYVLGGMGGLSINEAMVFGKPVICSVCDGTEKKLVREGYNGYYFNEGDLNDLVKKIGLILSDEEKINEMGKKSLQIINNEVNINTVIKGYLNAFNYVSGNKHNLSLAQ